MEYHSDKMKRSDKLESRIIAHVANISIAANIKQTSCSSCVSQCTSFHLSVASLPLRVFNKFVKKNSPVKKVNIKKKINNFVVSGED